MANPIFLYVRDPQNTPIGRLIWAGLQADAPTGIKIAMEFVPWSTTQLGAARWLALAGVVSNQKTQRRSFGRLEMEVREWPQVDPLIQSTVTWLWRLLPEDIEAIERARSDSPSAPLSFRVDVQGIIQRGPSPGASGSDAYPITGEGVLEVPLSQWQTLLAALGYGVAPSAAQLAGLGATTHPAWAKAEEFLKGARTHLLRGEDYAALISCLNQFEAVVTAPYNAASWKPLVQGMPPQKADSITDLLGAHCTYLNRVGHHRGLTLPPGQGQLDQMPLDHWEAELAVASSQFLLAYALRLKP